MVSKQKTSKFVLMPGTNVWNVDEPGTSLTFLRSVRRQINAPMKQKFGLASARGEPAKRLQNVLLPRSAAPASAKATKTVPPTITVLDEVAPQESLLVKLTPAEVVEIARTQPGLRLVQVVELKPLWLRSLKLSPPVLPMGAKARTPFTVTVCAAGSGEPLPGVTVYGYTDRSSLTGVQDVTDASGTVRLMLPAGMKEFEVVEVDAPFGYWGVYARRVKVAKGALELRCLSIDLAAQEVRDHFSLRGADLDGDGVVVGVIDTGANQHPDLQIAAGVNVIKDQPVDNIRDELGHGTHVCGIIAGRGVLGSGTRGVAPGVALNVYKVFGPRQKTADSFNIAKAIRQAVNDGCDLINLSLGADSDMPDVFREVQRARALGVVCIAATGNDMRAPVGYPAAYSQVLAVSAMGRKGTYPRRATQELNALAPFGKDPDNFIADFSNVGPQVALAGPGVGIVSTLKRGYAVMDGTSMACPAVTGAVARLLSRNKKILEMDRNQKRSDAIIKLALGKAQLFGFGSQFEGAGILV